MIKNLFAGLLLLLPAIVATPASAEEEAAGPKYTYFTLEPEITTNFVTKGKNLGFINVRVDLMVDDPAKVQILEHHSPLIRDAITQVLSQESETEVKSLNGREELRKACLEKVNALLLAETKERVVTELLFTKYLYQ
ncbi:flagellar basal body-associated protein FliL [Parasalinivibrio latis]|uniref:flagellar basal body-associated protein FliL n=1 Tax=Parasalinivibrio latis TaxID=2952610 RepID=UPI0030E2D88A